MEASADYASPLLGNPRASAERMPRTDYERWVGQPAETRNVAVPPEQPLVPVTPAVPARNQTLQKEGWCRARDGWPASHSSEGWPVVSCTADGAAKPLVRMFGAVHSKY